MSGNAIVINDAEFGCESACMPTELPRNRSQATTRYVPRTAHHRTKRSRLPKNGFGTSGVVLALVGLACSLVPIAGFGTWLVIILGISFSTLGIVLSILGLLKVKKGTADNKGVGTAGITLSVIGVAVCVTWLVLSTMNAGAEGLHIPASTADRHTVEFVVTSTGGASVRYGSIAGQRAEAIPASTDAWRQKASYNRGSYLVTVTADNMSASLNNTITCSLFLDGTKVAENSGPTIALCTANVN